MNFVAAFLFKQGLFESDSIFISTKDFHKLELLYNKDISIYASSIGSEDIHLSALKALLKEYLDTSVIVNIAILYSKIGFFNVFQFLGEYLKKLRYFDISKDKRAIKFASNSNIIEYLNNFFESFIDKVICDQQNSFVLNFHTHQEAMGLVFETYQ